MLQPPTRLPCCPSGTGRRWLASARGFTLVELIMVIVMLGILAAYAAPRMFDNTAFNARGFHDETLAYLRYAQKTAVAQRRTVCVTFTSSSLTLAIASVAATTSCATAGTLTGPKGDSGSAITLSAKGGVTYSGTTPVSFNFDGLGQPINPATGQTLQVVGASNSITVEAGTGYVHE